MREGESEGEGGREGGREGERVREEWREDARDVGANSILLLFLPQCKVLRDYYVSRPKEKRMMSEKVRASILFKGKKSLYTQT